MEATIFDIDGTLIDSFEADAELFIQAVRDALGMVSIRGNWSDYLHVTDQGILREIMHDNCITPQLSLFETTRSKFFSLLAAHIQEHGPFQEIPGAVDFVSNLLAREAHYVAYATGAWRESAIVKLLSAGFPIENVCISTSSDFEDRISIMKNALSAAPSSIDKITYFGDAVWDEAAVRELGWDFVAVGDALGGISSYYDAAA